MSSRQPLADPPPDFFAHRHRHRHALPKAALAGVVAAAAVTAAAVLVVLVVVLFLLYRRLAGGRTAPTAPSPPTEANEVGAAAKLRQFSYAQLRRATGSFSPCLKLGQGGFGPVFRASLSSVEVCAVKLMDSGSLQGEREFRNELALAAAILSAPISSGEEAVDHRLVVFPIGFCSEEHRHRRRRWQRWWRRKPSPPADASPAILEASACSRATAQGRRLLLVYELMHNGSLQDALLDRRCPELMDWGRRFAVILDVARGLEFLHTVCDPPVIHGDIKASNILLDAEFSAKIGDFGLARIKSTSDEMPAAAEEVVVEIDSDDNADANDRKKEISMDRGGEDDISLMEDAAESIITSTMLDEHDVIAFSERAPEEHQRLPDTMPSPSETGHGFDRESVDSGMGSKTSVGGWKGNQKKSRTMSGKDWWWRQDVGSGREANSEAGGRNAKDYVMEWIRSEIKKERPRNDFAAPPVTLADECLPKSSNARRAEGKWSHRRSEWWTLLDDEKAKKREKTRPPPREWWREEFCEELTNKRKTRVMTDSRSSIGGGEELRWWQKDDDFMLHADKRRGRKKKCRSGIDWWNDAMSWEIKSSTRRSSQDHASCCDVPRSGTATVSSTPSMRGTVCYVAPEYGSGESLSEKCDIYSFGVLLLVIIAGRRPLQVIASPMSEFERANLMSWARQLARMGRLLDLVDTSLRGVDSDQALLCITIALLCLQRSPTHRPSSKEIVGMLTGQMEPPHLPLEFSPSPPGGFRFKSHKKNPCA